MECGRTRNDSNLDSVASIRTLPRVESDKRRVREREAGYKSRQAHAVLTHSRLPCPPLLRAPLSGRHSRTPNVLLRIAHPFVSVRSRSWNSLLRVDGVVLLRQRTLACCSPSSLCRSRFARFTVIYVSLLMRLVAVI